MICTSYTDERIRAIVDEQLAKFFRYGLDGLKPVTTATTATENKPAMQKTNEATTANATKTATANPDKCPVPGCPNWKKPQYPVCYICNKEGKKVPQ